jgi:hypothetical protein
VCYLAVLTGVGLICFSQKFAKEGDCWICVCWLHFCLKQIFTSDVGHNIPTSRPGLYVLGFAYVYARACLIEGIHTSMCWYEPCAIMRSSEHMWFLKELLKWLRKVFLRWLLMSLLSRSFFIRPCCLINKSLIRSEAWLKEWHTLLQYIKEPARPEDSLKTLVYKIEFCLGFESYIFWAFRVSSWCMFRTVLWVVILCTTQKLLSKELGRLWTASKLLSKIACCYFWG